MGKKSFVFYESWLEAVKSLPVKLQLDAIFGIIENGLYGESEKSQNPVVKAILCMAQEQMNLNRKRYENGCKGGAPRGNTNARKNNQKQPKTTEGDDWLNSKQPNYNDNYNDNYMSSQDNKLSLDDNLGKIRHLSSSTSENVDDVSDARKEKRDLANAFIDFYNEQVKAKGSRLRICQSRTDERLAYIMARLDEYGEEKVKEVINKAIASRGLNYDMNIAPADLEWIMRPRNFPRILEGKYDNKPRDTMRNRIHFEGESDPHAYDEDERIAQMQKENGL